MTNANDFISPTTEGQFAGLTKREYFAAIAIQAMLVNGGQTEHAGKTFHPTSLAIYATKQADALINELNK